MCGSYSSTQKAEILKERFHIDEILGELKLPRYNITPSQLAPVIISKTGKRILTEFKWGLIPSWSKDPAIWNKMINARSDTLMEKRSFNRLLKDHRCLVPADGFYEWVGEDLARVPMRILLKSREPYAFAGLWDSWKDPSGKEFRTYTIITTSAENHSLMQPLHHRMPVILDHDKEELWLGNDMETGDLVKTALTQYPADSMTAYQVS